MHVYNKKKFVIFTHFRTGSRGLVEIMRSQNVMTFDEPFNPEHSFDQEDEINKKYFNRIKKEHICASNRFIPKYSCESPKSILYNLTNEYDCFKHIFLQTSKNFNETIIANCPIIFLRRKNLLKSALSFLIALKTNVWHKSDINLLKMNPSTNDIVDRYKNIGSINIGLLKKTIKDYQSINFYEPLLKKSIKVWYEDLYSPNWKSVIENIFDFIDLDIIDWNSIQKIMDKSNKLNNKNLYSHIENINEIVALGSDEIGYLN